MGKKRLPYSSMKLEQNEEGLRGLVNRGLVAAGGGVTRGSNRAAATGLGGILALAADDITQAQPVYFRSPLVFAQKLITSPVEARRLLCQVPKNCVSSASPCRRQPKRWLKR